MHARPYCVTHVIRMRGTREGITHRKKCVNDKIRLDVHMLRCTSDCLRFLVPADSPRLLKGQLLRSSCFQRLRRLTLVRFAGPGRVAPRLLSVAR
jgi:hypothetical protein